MSRPAAEDRLRRILAVVPWVAAHDGPTLAEVCSRFGYGSEADLRADLDLLFVCGVPPYTPDALIEVDMNDRRVWIRYADYLSRPLRLTPAEALAVVASGSALLGADPDPEGPLARALAKLAGALGLGAEAVVEVELADPGEALAVLEQAVATSHQVEIVYYNYGRDLRTTRVIDPWLVWSTQGQWYVAAWCHLAVAERLFRVDRIEEARPLSTTFSPPLRRTAPPPVFAGGDTSVVLDLAPEERWVIEQYPTKNVKEIGGRLRVTLAVSGEAWLARLLLRLGPDAEVVRGDTTLAARTATRVLARYRPIA